jgi:hypothetical protein
MEKRNLGIRRRGLSLLVWGAVVSGLSCGDSNEPSTTGRLRITVATTGEFLDPDGYVFSLDGIGFDPPYTLQGTGIIEIPNIVPGYHTVQLIGLAINCVVADGDQRTLEIPAGELSRAAFAVSCVMPSTFSTLQIRTTTVGPGTDPDGYTVRVDEGDWQAIGLNGSLAVPGLSPGVHIVFLGGLAPNCEIPWSPNPQSVTIDASIFVNGDFTVYCN